LPLGLDGLVAEWFGERLADTKNAVLLPTCWLPITTLPHPMSLQVRTEVFRAILDDQLNGLVRAGARVICLVTGHYAQGHEVELYESAIRCMKAHPGVSVIAGTPLELLEREELMDHAGRWETAQLLAIKPDLVHVDKLPAALSPKDCAVLGEDPRWATSADGIAILEEGLAAWHHAVDKLLAGDNSFLAGYYSRRMASYSEYKARFFTGSWEEAIDRWWASID
jgi:creatinine amidohydrolase